MEQIDLFLGDSLHEITSDSLHARTKNYLMSKKQLMFNDFWILYDKKVAKFPARKAFLKLTFKEIEQAMFVVRDYVASTPDEKFRCHAATWLNQKRFIDEIIVPKTKEQQQDDEFKKVLQSRLNKYHESNE